jgi:hypothetical protein
MESFDSELARANLFRLRGDYAAAEQHCLGLLDRTPHDPTVSALLGDIAAEQDQLESAARWYEVAVDSDSSAGLADKLAAIRARIKERDSAKAEHAIGLEPKTHVPPTTLLGAAVVLVLLVAAAYMAGVSQHNAAQAQVQQPPVIIPQDQPVTPVIHAPVQPPAESKPPTSTAKIDADLQVAFASPDATMAKVTVGEYDPRTKLAIITASSAPGDDSRKLAANIAEELYAKDPAVSNATIRITQDGKLTYAADTARDAFTTEPGAAERPDLTAGLTNEWPPASESPGNLAPHGS